MDVALQCGQAVKSKQDRARECQSVVRDRASEAVQRQARSIGRHRRQHARVLRLHHLQLLRHPDRPYLLPDGKRVRQPDAVTGDFRRRLRDAADRRNRARDLIRPDRPAACHAAELRAHGAIDPDHRAHAVYQSIGLAAPVIVIAARMAQGFALGGEVGPTTAYLIEIAPPQHRALVVAWQPASQEIAATAGALVGVIMSRTMAPEMLDAYGWRVAFLIGPVCLPFGFWMRRTLPETIPQAEAGARTVEHTSHLSQARRHLDVIGLALMILASGTISTYVTQYMTTYAQNTLHVSSTLAFAVSLVSNGIQFVGALVGGWLADRLGRKPVMIWPQLATLPLTYPTFLWIVHAPGALSLLVGFGVLSVIGSLPFTAFYATFTEALPQNIRGGVFATVYAVAIASFGGTAQLVVTWLLHVTGNPLAPAWYLLLAAIVGLGAMSLMPETAPVKQRQNKI